MENPRPEKVAVVDEVRERLDSTSAALLTEYRGLDVSAISDLRRALRAAGGEYKIYKNTLVRFAARDLGLELEELLTGPTAIAFVPSGPMARPVMRSTWPRPCATSPGPTRAWSSRAACWARSPSPPTRPRPWPTWSPARCCSPSSPARSLPRWCSSPACSQALPRNFAYGLKALIDQQGGVPEEAPAADEPADEPEAAEAPEAEDGTRRRGRAADEPPPRPHRRRRRSPRRLPPRSPRPTTPPRRRADHGHQGRHPRLHRQHDRPRALRAPQGLRGEVRRHRRRARRRGRRRPPPVAAVRPRPRRRRTSSTSSSPRPATRRSRSSRRCARSPASASRRPRTWSTAPPSPSSRRCRKEDAEKAKAALEEAGGNVELK